MDSPVNRRVRRAALQRRAPPPPRRDAGCAEVEPRPSSGAYGTSANAPSARTRPTRTPLRARRSRPNAGRARSSQPKAGEGPGRRRASRPRAAHAHGPPGRVAPERRVAIGVPVREDGESGRDTGRVPRREKSSEGKGRHDVAVRDDEVISQEAALERAPDAARRAEDLVLDGPGDRDARVRVAHRGLERAREMVRVHDESVGPLLEQVVEDEGWSAAERQERLRVVSRGRKRAEAGRDEGDHRAKTITRRVLRARVNQSDVRLADAVRLRRPARRSAPDCGVVALDLREEAEWRLVHDDEGPRRSGNSHAARRFVSEPRPVASARDARDGPVRRRRFPLDALFTPAAPPPVLERGRRVRTPCARAAQPFSFSERAASSKRTPSRRRREAGAPSALSPSRAARSGTRNLVSISRDRA